MEIALSLKNITFGYSNLPIIKDFSLDIEKGSFITLLGASGSGKTTLLRLIAGFLKPKSGEILVNNKKVNNILPEDREIGMVFQDYALFPHMTVKDNILYGIKIKNKKLKLSTNEITNLLTETIKNLDLQDLLERYPSELSGGQQQRVALARALILKPSILLMDEPLSSLDTKLRQTVRTELKEIQKKLNITTIYVTHDQEEALVLSDKIALLEKGILQQYDTSNNLYFNPVNKFCAEFIGAANFIILHNKEYLVRPEWISLSVSPKDKDSLKGIVISSDFLGSKIRYYIQVENQIIIADRLSTLDSIIEKGTIIYINFDNKKEL